MKDGDSGCVAGVPAVAGGRGVDGDGAAFAAEDFVPVAWGGWSVGDAGDSIGTEAGEHSGGRGLRLREGVDFGEGAEAAVEVLEVGGVGGGADGAGFRDGVKAAPETAVVAEVEHERVACIPGQGVLVLADLSAEAGGGVGGVTPDTAVGEAAAEEIIGAGKDQCVLLRGDGGEGEIVVAVEDGSAAALACRFERTGIELLGEGDAGIGAEGAAAETGDDAGILPEALILVEGVDGPGEGIACVWIDGEGAAEDGTSGDAGRALFGGTVGSGEARARLDHHPGEGDAVGGLVVAVVADGGDEEFADGVPYDGGSGIAVRRIEGIGGALDIFSRAIGDVAPGASLLRRRWR